MFFFIRSKMNPRLVMDLRNQDPDPGTPVVVDRRSDAPHHVTQHWEWCLGEAEGSDLRFYVRNRLHTFVVEREAGNDPELKVFVAPQDCDEEDLVGSPPTPRGALQRWELVPARGDFYFIRSKVRGDRRRDLVLEVKRARNRAKTPVVASPKERSGNDHQLWELLPVCPDARD